MLKKFFLFFKAKFKKPWRGQTIKDCHAGGSDWKERPITSLISKRSYRSAIATLQDDKHRAEQTPKPYYKYSLGFLLAFLLLISNFQYPLSTNAALDGDGSGLVGWWKFDEVTGTVAADSSDNRNNGTLVNSPIWTTGQVGGGVVFDGIGYVSIGNPSSLQLNDNLSICLWARPKGNTQFFISKSNGSTRDYALYVGGGGVLYLYESTTGAIGPGSSVTLNKWQHLCVVATEGVSTIFYKNTIPTSAGAPTITNTNKNLSIGRDGSASGFQFNGEMDDVRVYNRALTQAEISDIYNQGQGVASSDIQAPSIPSNLSATVIYSSQINLSWTPSTDNTAVAGYRLYRNGAELTTTINTSYSDTSLTPSTLYSYAISAYDSAGNASSQSLSVQATTQAQTPATYTLTITNTGGGTITSNPGGINCGTICQASFNNGTSITLTPTPNSGYTFQGWSGGCSGNGLCTITLGQDVSITGNFIEASSAGGTAWYVDNSVSTSGDGKSWVAAWKNFSNIDWANIKPGHTLYISGGSASKTYNETLTIGASGTSGSPVFIKPGAAEPLPNPLHSGTVIISGTYIPFVSNAGVNPPNSNSTRHGIRAVNRSYVTIDGNSGAGNRMIQITNVNRGAYFESSSIGNIVRYVAVRDSFIGVYMQNDNGGLVEFVDGRGLDGGGIRVSGIHHAAHTSTVRNNYLEARFYDGLSIDSGVDVYGNWVRKADNEEWTSPTHFSHPDGMPIGGSNNYIWNNRVDGFEQNIYVDNILYYSNGHINETLTNIWIWGNLITTSSIDPVLVGKYGIVLHAEMGDIDGVHIFNNTITPNVLGIRTSINGNYKIHNLEGKNNILGNGWSIEEGVNKPTFVSDYNCFITVSSGYEDGEIHYIYSLENWKSITGQDTHSVSGVPGYLNEANQDWRLSSNSICKDIGASLGSDIMSALSGTIFPNPATINRFGTWDAGAYEYVSGTPTPLTCASFTYSSWSSCTGGTQTRTVLTSSPAGCTGGSPITSQSCTMPLSPDTTPPTISITSPLNNTTTSGQAVLISASASNPSISGQTQSGIFGVQFKIDNINLFQELTIPPYSGTWNTIGVANGSHTISAVARDNNNNRATSTITIIINSAQGGSASGGNPINGSCSSTLNTCTTGALSNIDDSSTNYLWNCVGSNGGTTANCSLGISGAGTGSGTGAGAGTGTGSLPAGQAGGSGTGSGTGSGASGQGSTANPWIPASAGMTNGGAGMTENIGTFTPTVEQPKVINPPLINPPTPPLLKGANAIVSYPITNDKLYNRLKGRIILKVESKGEAYYISPKDKIMYYLGRPEDAFRIMRERGLGITNNDLNKIGLGFVNPLKSPLPPLLKGVNAADSDQDGLSDMLEESIGTNKLKADTDNDGFSDYDELMSNYSPLAKDKKLTLDTNLAKKLMGKILLQVQSKGEAYYINPLDLKKYYLARPMDAFNIMRWLGLGISNKDYGLMGGK